jgi:hypothetical protein
MPQHPHSNRLISEKSPYLLQHAHNPVDWVPWGEEAFARAAAEDKPVFLSIGYSTCHWCHVMERESFEDEQVAALLNDGFVSVKVDREERPDIDSVYMAVCQAVTGSGGWPLTIIMTPDRQPFFAGTYLPKEARFGRPGMLEVLPRVRDFWHGKRGEALDLAQRIREALAGQGAVPAAQQADDGLLKQAYAELQGRYDPRHGGFGRAPKFPTPHNLSFLLRRWQDTGEPQALRMVEHTLQAIRRGGIFDQLGFGIHRYSTDAEWLVPHFEKMLYDQALLTIASLEAYQATRDPQVAEMAREIITYVRRDMTSPEGAFYSAEDADSEGVEGKFYVWTEAELREALPGDLADLAMRAYGASPEGNFTDEASGEAVAANILHLPQPVGEARDRLEEARRLLLARREQRVRPLRDDKILADWNGLMVAALARAAWALDDPDCLQAANEAADFVLGRMRDGEGRLWHRFRDGEAAIPGYLDDYAFMAWGLIELYEAGFDPARLEQARDLMQHLLDHFWDPESGGFYATAPYHEELLLRSKDTYDGAVPSGNSVALLNLLRLSRLLGEAEYEQRAEALTRALAGDVARMPSAYTQFLVGLEMALQPGQEIVIAGGTEAERRALLGVLRERFLPHAVVLVLEEQTAPALTALAPWLADYPAAGQPAAAYVCQGGACQSPVTTPASLAAALM